MRQSPNLTIYNFARRCVILQDVWDFRYQRRDQHHPAPPSLSNIGRYLSHYIGRYSRWEYLCFSKTLMLWTCNPRQGINPISFYCSICYMHVDTMKNSEKCNCSASRMSKILLVFLVFTIVLLFLWTASNKPVTYFTLRPDIGTKRLFTANSKSSNNFFRWCMFQ